MQKIILVEYDPSWPLLFVQEKKKLRAILPKDAVIEHIGSTAVPGLIAKPVIDIMIGVPTESMLTACVEPIKQLGYTYVPEYEKGMPERRYFRKKINDMATHHIHMVVKESPFWKRHLFFRDYLRTHPAAVQEYAALKKELAQKHTDMNDYANAKNEFIRNIEKLCIA